MQVAVRTGVAVPFVVGYFGREDDFEREGDFVRAFVDGSESSYLESAIRNKGELPEYAPRKLVLPASAHRVQR